MKTKKHLPDFLDDIVEVRSRKNPRFPGMVKSAVKKRRTGRDRWTPIRRGKIYCSPDCGRGCTVAEHDEAVDVLLLPTYRVFEITSESEESEMERVHVTSTDEDLISVLKHMKLLPRRLSESRISEDFDRGTWTIYVKDVPGECKGFRPFLKLVGPWNEAMS